MPAVAPFKPVADDDGIDLLLFDKLTGSAIPLQVKSRTGFDDPKAQTVQFDVRHSTFAARGYTVMALVDRTTIRTLWLIPGGRLADVATRKPGKFVVVACAKAASKDRYREFRHDGFEPALQEIFRQIVRPCLVSWPSDECLALEEDVRMFWLLPTAASVDTAES